MGSVTKCENKAHEILLVRNLAIRYIFLVLFVLYYFAGPNMYCGTLQQKGTVMVHKTALGIMGCEIPRLLQLTQNAIVTH